MPEQRQQPRGQRQRQSCKDWTLLHAGHPLDKDAPESLTFHRPGLDSQVPGTTYKPCSTMLPPVTFSPAHLPTCPGHWALCSSSNTPHLPLTLPSACSAPHPAPASPLSQFLTLFGSLLKYASPESLSQIQPSLQGLSEPSRCLIFCSVYHHVLVFLVWFSLS